MTTSPSMDVKNQSAPCSCMPWVVVFSAALFFFFQFIQVNMFNSLSEVVYQHFQASNLQFSNLAANYFYGDVLFLFPAGIIVDRFSTRKVLIFTMLICVLSTFGLAMATHIRVAEICRFINGAGGAFCLLAIVRLASRWFPPSRMAFVIGLAITFAMVGGLIAQTPLAHLASDYGYQKTMIINGFFGVVCYLLVLLFVRDFPKGRVLEEELEHQQQKTIGFWRAIVLVLKNPQNWLAGLYACFINLPVFILGATSANAYLQQIGRFSLINASFISGSLFIGLIIGCPLFGWWSDTLGRRRLPMMVGALLSLLMILGIMYIPPTHFSLELVLFFILGISISSQTIAYPYVAEHNPECLTGTANGVASVLIMSGGFLITVAGYLMSINWDHVVINHVPQYHVENFHHAFMMMPIAFVAAFIFSLFFKETHCQRFSDRKES